MVKNASDTQSFKFIPLTKENYLKDLLDKADEAFKNYLGFNKSIEVLSKKLLIPDERHWGCGKSVKIFSKCYTD